jgi:hypothetical protein
MVNDEPGFLQGEGDENSPVPYKYVGVSSLSETEHIMVRNTTKPGWFRRALMATAFVGVGALTLGATPASAQYYYGGYYPYGYGYPYYAPYAAYYPYYGYPYGYGYGYPIGVNFGWGWGWRGGWGGWHGGWGHGGWGHGGWGGHGGGWHR